MKIRHCLLFLLLPVIANCQKFEINRHVESFLDATLKKQVQDSVYSIHGWLYTSDTNKVNMRMPYLQFVVKKRKSGEFYLSFSGQFIKGDSIGGSHLISNGVKDSVEFEFENGEKLKLSVLEGEMYFDYNVSAINIASLSEKVSLNQLSLDRLKMYSIRKISFFSIRSQFPECEFFVREKWRTRISTSIKELQK